MADLKAAVYEYLAADAGIAALVGTRIYPLQAPQGAALPYLVYTRVSAEPTHHYGGRAGLTRQRVQFDVYAASSTSAEGLAEELRTTLDAYSGTMGATAQLVVRVAYLENAIDQVVPPADASEAGPFRITMDFMFWHQES